MEQAPPNKSGVAAVFEVEHCAVSKTSVRDRSDTAW